MSRLMQILIAAGVVLTIVLVFLMMGNFGSAVPSRTVEASFGDHLVTVKGHYQDLTQETVAEGLLITVDGKKIAVTDGQVTAAGLTHPLQPGQNVEILVDEKGEIEVGVAAPGADSASDDAAPE